MAELMIDNVNDSYRYTFPTVDFKFQNTGTATALLWQFVVNVLQVEIDITPVLTFQMTVEDRCLLIEVKNDGWGSAKNCHIQIDEIAGTSRASDRGYRRHVARYGLWDRTREELDRPHQLLNTLFPESMRSFQGEISRREHKVLSRFSKEQADPEQLKTVTPTLIGRLRIRWSCEDEKGNQHQGEAGVDLQHSLVGDDFDLDDPYDYLDSDCCGVAFTQEGFFSNRQAWEQDTPAAPFFSTTTYIALIDPSKGPHERRYPFSRKIPLGDVERFHIMIGASISCRLLIQFKFFIDQATVVESEHFDVHIHNTTGLVPGNYIDGQAVARSRDEPEMYWEQEDLNLFRPETLNLFEYVQAWPSFPTEQPYNYAKGDMLFQKKQYMEAIAAFGQAIALESGKPSLKNMQEEKVSYEDLAYYHRGLSFYHLQRYEEALKDFRHAMSAGYYNKNICTYTIRALTALGMHDEAQKVYEEARRHGMLIARSIPKNEGQES